MTDACGSLALFGVIGFRRGTKRTILPTIFEICMHTHSCKLHKVVT